jgi:hypothetical protein
VHNKIGFAIFGFLYDFILILQVTGSKGKNLKNLLPLKPLELLNIHTNTLGSCTQALGEKSLHIHTLPLRGKLADGEVRPEEANKQCGKVIGLTCDRFAVVARPERGPAMAGGEVVVARPPRLGFRGNASEARPSSAIGGSRVG